ncbi:hypothetical protein [Nostoc sp.]
MAVPVFYITVQPLIACLKDFSKCDVYDGLRQRMSESSGVL